MQAHGLKQIRPALPEATIAAVNAFWFITIYDPEGELVRDPITPVERGAGVEPAAKAIRLRPWLAPGRPLIGRPFI